MNFIIKLNKAPPTESPPPSKFICDVKQTFVEFDGDINNSHKIIESVANCTSDEDGYRGGHLVSVNDVPVGKREENVRA